MGRDLLRATAAEPEWVRAFWQGWFDWSDSVGIDYFIGRKMPSFLVGLNLGSVAAEGHTALYNGGSPWAAYWLETLKELRPRLIESGYITEILMSEFDTLYSDPRSWTSAIPSLPPPSRQPPATTPPPPTLPLP